MKKLFAFFGIMLFSCVGANELANAKTITKFSAKAAPRGETIQEFTLTNLQGFEGNKISIYFVAGREAALGTPGQELVVNKVFAGPFSLEVSDTGTVVLPDTFVPLEGWYSFNYAVFVIHGQPLHFLSNRNGSEIKYYNNINPIADSTLNRHYLLKTFVTKDTVKNSRVISINRLKFTR